MKIYKVNFLILITAFLGGCASMPAPINVKLTTNPDIATVHANIDNYVGEKVRWGGSIEKVNNTPSNTVLEIVGRPLDDQGRPIQSDQSPGRFLVEATGFLDPAIYARGRLITVVGVIKGKVTQNIGDYTYTFPELTAYSYYLWPKRQNVYYVNPYWYDPWYPWYPYGYGYPRFYPPYYYY